MRPARALSILLLGCLLFSGCREPTRSYETAVELRLKPSDPQAWDVESLERGVEILRGRLESVGWPGIVVTLLDGVFHVFLPDMSRAEIEELVEFLMLPGQLEFRLVHEHSEIWADSMTVMDVPEGYSWRLDHNLETPPRPILLADAAVLKGNMVRSARPEHDEFGRILVEVELTPEGARSFHQFTRDYAPGGAKNSGAIARRLAIVVDGEILSAPAINQPIAGGNLDISGEFTFEEASRLALLLSAEPMPGPLILHSMIRH